MQRIAIYIVVLICSVAGVGLIHGDFWIAQAIALAAVALLTVGTLRLSGRSDAQPSKAKDFRN